MGYIVEAKLLKFNNTYLFQRRCDKCGDDYLFHGSETIYSKCFVCETCEPLSAEELKTKIMIENGSAIYILNWENRLTLNYKMARKNTRNFKIVLREDNFICQYCYEEGNTVDHIIPVCYGGNNNRENLVCACSTCNGLASSLIFTSFSAKQRFLY